MMTESSIVSPTSTTPSTEFGSIGTKMGDKISYRKSSKPMMERKRRARINHCLGQLKSLVLQAMKKDNSQYSKLEKADILELTVKHLKQVQRMQTQNSNPIPEALNKYRAGFNECANEVMRYLGETQGVNSEAKTRILSHLTSILSPVNSLVVQQPPSSHTHILPAPPPQPAPSSHHHPLQLHQHHQPKPQSVFQQQQQELLQHKLQADLIHAKQQPIPLIPTPHPDPTPMVIDYNNNSIHNNNGNNMNNNTNINSNNNNNETLNRNLNSTLINKNNNFSISSNPSVVHTNNSMTHSDIKQVVAESNIALRALNINNSLTAPLQVPCLTAPATLTTAPFQLVHSTLPNGQVALVLAPQAIPSMSLYTNPNPSKMVNKAVDLTTSDHHQPLSLKQGHQSNQTPQPQRIPSPSSAPHPSSPSRENYSISTHKKPKHQDTKTSHDLYPTNTRLEQPSAFRQPTSLPSTSGSASSSSGLPPPTSSAPQTKANPLTNVSRQTEDSTTATSTPSHSSPDPVSFSRKEDPGAASGHSGVDSVRGPQDVTSVRELFEYKMGKRRSDSVVVGKTKSTWRPW